MIRREFLAAIATTSSAAFVSSLSAQQPAPDAPSNVMGPMEQRAYRPVRLPAKASDASTVTREDREKLEYQLGCQCGCDMSIYICRTTDFTCQVSPAMHRDINTLADTGYSAKEILAAFSNVYGEKVLLAPPRRGFNWLAYLMPFAVMLTGFVVVTSVVRKLRTRAVDAAVIPPAEATPEELARLQSAVRDESR